MDKKIKIFFKYTLDEHEKGSVKEFDEVQANRYLRRGALIATDKHEQEKSASKEEEKSVESKEEKKDKKSKKKKKSEKDEE